jgi:Asp-tRNA(Asn)/Glu-tRNA(Gln) amidotransferase A subunit family amidase
MNRRTFLAQTAAVAAWTAACRSASTDVPADLTQLSASAAVAAMRRGDLNAEDYARALLDRAQRLSTLNAFRVIERDRVLEAARTADKARKSGGRLGLLHGLPIPVKDSVNTASLPTTNGTAALKDFRPKTDAAVVTKLLAQGALVMGKTNLHELSLGWTSNNATFGPVHNPYDMARIPGGSSGGSAAAVAARIAPLAVAEDTLGSIRIPSTLCGISGLRPTFGRYADDGIMPLSENKFDQVGPVARSVEDLALFDTAITGEASALGPADLKGVRIGASDFFLSDLDPEVERVTSAALDRLRAAGVTIVKADIPADVKQALPAALTIIVFEVGAALSHFLQAHETGVTLEQLIEQTGANVKPLFLGQRPPQAAYEAMLAQRARVRDAIASYFTQHDIAALAFPPAMTAAPRIGEEGDLAVGGKTLPASTVFGRGVSLGSCASLASLVLPAGLTSSGLPVGLEFDAPSGADRRLLALGVSLERALGPIAAPKI